MYVMHLSNLLRALYRQTISIQATYQLFRIIDRRFLLFLLHLQRYLKSILLSYQRSMRQLKDLFFRELFRYNLFLLTHHKFQLFDEIAIRLRCKLVFQSFSPKQLLFHVGS